MRTVRHSCVWFPPRVKLELAHLAKGRHSHAFSPQSGACAAWGVFTN